MQLLINVGGEGKRLGKLTAEIPKPMIRLCGKPVLEHLVGWAVDSGFSEVILLCGYKYGVIQDYFKDGREFNIPIRYSIESTPLGSGGAVKHAEQLVSDTFAYMNGDLVCRVDFDKMLQTHCNLKPAMTIFLHESSHPEDSDILCVDEGNRITKFICKKGKRDSICGRLTNAGLCIMEPQVFKYMKDEAFAFEPDLYPRLISAGEYLNAYVSDDTIFDMGTPERLEYAEKIMCQVLISI